MEGSNAGCTQACKDSHPGGVPEYDKVYACFYGPGNDPKDLGACSKACGN